MAALLSDGPPEAEQHPTGGSGAVNQEERAARAWPVLTARAEDRRTITYSDLAGAIGIHHRPVRYVLAVIQDYCLRMQWPPLTVLVISKSGQVGSGFIAGDRLAPKEARDEVFEFPWAEHRNPFSYALNGSSINSMALEVVAKPDTAESVYRRVRDRGSTQALFRRVLLSIYGSKCAFCGFSFEAALEGAHIIPWSEAEPADRVHPTNGLLLCATHHKLFDAGLLAIRDDFSIVAAPAVGASRELRGADQESIGALLGREIRLPTPTSLAPQERCLRWHREKHVLDQ